MSIKAVIFDLDGTLLDTLGDLASAVNTAMRRHGFPLLDEDDVCGRVGNGVRRLIEQSVPAGTPPSSRSPTREYSSPTGIIKVMF